MADTNNLKSCAIGVILLDGLIKDTVKCEEKDRVKTITTAAALATKRLITSQPFADHIDDDQSLHYFNSELLMNSDLSKPTKLVEVTIEKFKYLGKFSIDQRDISLFKDITVKLIEELAIFYRDVRSSNDNPTLVLSVSLTHQDYVVIEKYLSEKSNSVSDIWKYLFEEFLDSWGCSLDIYAVTAIETETLKGEIEFLLKYEKLPDFDEGDNDQDNQDSKISTLLN